MDETLTAALREFQLGTRHEHWYGKTYREFWAWFGEQETALLAQASEADMEALREELFELTADCDDAGYAMPPEYDDRPIERP
ncbi:hypothetical protein [Luteimonas sp. MC1750]|uniref:hypothetical protein n=1 Tax=Luteimonas sp. MC1750 TaxID=2799326 RepID=UPI0018F0FC16|nr:hypothetical protein [Luteimonas sp. MC1750]MBJ6983970.1 hypothetical protein [Luteimonas sp. MC1750]QQO06783.1 hypothetical protein JGR68_04990 [Luteimonas sp. MC1750]